MTRTLRVGIFILARRGSARASRSTTTATVVAPSSERSSRRGKQKSSRRCERRRRQRLVRVKPPVRRLAHAGLLDRVAGTSTSIKGDRVIARTVHRGRSTDSQSSASRSCPRADRISRGAVGWRAANAGFEANGDRGPGPVRSRESVDQRPDLALDPSEVSVDLSDCDEVGRARPCRTCRVRPTLAGGLESSGARARLLVTSLIGGHRVASDSWQKLMPGPWSGQCRLRMPRRRTPTTLS